MRWLKKREIVIYYLIRRKFKDNKFNIGEVFDLLSPYFSKKVIKNSFSYLVKIGLIVKLNKMEYRAIPFEEYLNVVSLKYLKRRLILRRRTR